MNLSQVCIADLRKSADELNELIYGTDLPYIAFAEDPEKDRAQLEKLAGRASEEKLSAEVPRIAGKVKVGGKDLVLYKKFPEKDGVIDMNKDYDKLPLLIQGSIFAADAVRAGNIKFDNRFEFLKEELFSIQFSEKNPKYHFINDVLYESERKSDEILSPPQSYEAGWYLEATEPAWQAICEGAKEDCSHIGAGAAA